MPELVKFTLPQNIYHPFFILYKCTEVCPFLWAVLSQAEFMMFTGHLFVSGLVFSEGVTAVGLMAQLLQMTLFSTNIRRTVHSVTQLNQRDATFS